jgi:peptidyl-prolyl cis-trans isomerase A (cyclophilin A)
MFMAISSHADERVSVLMVTSEGEIEIEIELYTSHALITAGNFLRLVDDGDMNGGSFYRVVSYENDNGALKIEAIQGGRGDKLEGVFDRIDHESTEQIGILHTDGVISMVRGGVGTASSEFFNCIGDQPGLDHGQARNADGQGFVAFGKVTRGMDVVRAIQGLPADRNS